MNVILVCGAGFKAPSYHDLQGPLLEQANIDINLIIDKQKKISKKGCTILSDGWTHGRDRTLINFLVSPRGVLCS